MVKNTPSSWNRFQPQIDRVQNRGTFLWTDINKTSGGIIRWKIVFFKSVAFQLHARMLSSKVGQSLKSHEHFSDLGVGIALSHRHVGFFGYLANTSIHGLGEDDTARSNKSALDNSLPPLLNLKLSQGHKIAINGHFDFFQPLSNLTENCLSVACTTNLSRIHKKLSRPQGQIIDVKSQ